VNQGHAVISFVNELQIHVLDEVFYHLILEDFFNIELIGSLGNFKLEIHYIVGQLCLG
jgi:hypothetical protein